MKKFLSVALALIIALSAFSISVFASKSADKPTGSIAEICAGNIVNALTNKQPALETQSVAETGTDAPEEPEEPEETQTRYAAWCANVDNLEEVKFSTTTDFGIDYVTCIKGDAASLEFKYSGSRVKAIIKGNTTYFYFVNFPFFYFEAVGYEIGKTIRDSITINLGTFIGAKEENGYYVEEYDEGTGFIAHCYFKGDKLEKIEEFNETSGVYNEANVSYAVKDKEVKVPWYAVNLTPFASTLWFLFLFL